ncbi:hypothetical protein DCC85_13175 [Paenibacillus sp. CAA11]|uniref:hypothetical protein n=1 Tax=Paenibacillus sp. CAA11 TaxID=1532905 RepID=UPI000D373AC4|nr:hypothetical protein [Paenibacillus sp. CAA11]AWB45081.1 hypothetical protein DCC85_13175 [Paenibacillus sp. CAA11]
MGNEKTSEISEYMTESEISKLDEHMQTVIRDMLQEIHDLRAENSRLRKALLRASSQQPKMSSKLRDALYE